MNFSACDSVGAGKIFGESKRLSDTAGLVLDFIGELAAEILAGTEQVDNVAHMFKAGNDEYLFYSY
jgi:hypothetical protein